MGDGEDLEVGEEGFDAFARRQLPGLLRYATALTGDPHTAADVVQDVLVRACARWERVRRTDRPDLYVKKMITNEHLSWRRRWHTRSVVPVEDTALHARTPPAGDASADLADRDDLRRRLATLPRSQRAVLVLRFYEDLDDPEIAQVLGIAPGTVRSNASRALAALRRDAPGRDS
ncbi:SigE family RNA polymerase sigma factor [Quadrisphaera sp. DSM 44207]|uniref:SigE family RNA polymerase sigma factor n=1 Tax=Quadrisphaera sp. DSM 44207 TaxID=1881057 RepID=UPI000B805401